MFFKFHLTDCHLAHKSIRKRYRTPRPKPFYRNAFQSSNRAMTSAVPAADDSMSGESLEDLWQKIPKSLMHNIAVDEVDNDAFLIRSPSSKSSSASEETIVPRSSRLSMLHDVLNSEALHPYVRTTFSTIANDKFLIFLGGVLIGCSPLLLPSIYKTETWFQLQKMSESYWASLITGSWNVTALL